MHAILVNFHLDVSEPELIEAMGPKLQELASTTPGLVMKTFVAPDEEHRGAFYLFDTKESAEAYLEGEFYQWMSRCGLLSNLEARHFRVSDEPSAAFGTPSVPLGPAA